MWPSGEKRRYMFVPGLLGRRSWHLAKDFENLGGRSRALAKNFENLAESLATFVTLVSIQLALTRLARAWVVNSTVGLHDDEGQQIGW